MRGESPDISREGLRVLCAPAHRVAAIFITENTLSRLPVTAVCRFQATVRRIAPKI